MSAILAKIALVVLTSHALRVIGRAAGPRWGALALGLPCTSAVALAGCGMDRGVSVSLDMADHGLVGLVGAVALPLAFVEAARRRHRLSVCVLASAVGYFFAVWLGQSLGLMVVGGRLGVASLAALAGSGLAARLPASDPDEAKGRPPSHWQALALRTVVPIACLMAILAAGEVAGPTASGIVATFPGVGLTLLILTYLENGPGTAIRLARSVPSGVFGMVAFLGSFRTASAQVGLGWGMAIGYLAALGVLAAVGLFGHRWSWPTFGLGGRAREQDRPPIWPRPGRTFFPGVEFLAA
ncbi:hypothetical protein TA3x_001437 [Tundrisphaera sp. TA3]|uniref:hypothetical protein n=1 Tax=Tundrisphaera sp. TA3 TaxID=3435775 RepID=UPI003EBBB286